MVRMRASRWVLGAAAAATLAVAGCGGDDDESGEGAGTAKSSSSAFVGITEADLPEGFEKTAKITLKGKEWTFDNVPGHYWKVLDDRGYAVGLHFQTDTPHKWAQDPDIKKGTLLYIVYAIPGNCGDGSFAKASKSRNASIVGRLPAGFDHWHGLVGGGSKTGHWLMHIPVRDFTMAGPPDNPMDGTPVKAGTPGFMPVCDIR